MASADIALVCGLNFEVGCQDRLHVNSDADEALAEVSEVLAHYHFNDFLFSLVFSSRNSLTNKVKKFGEPEKIIRGHCPCCLPGDGSVTLC